MSKHILVFNDTQEILTLFRDILTDEGYRVSLHTFSTEELPHIRAAMPDLLIIDCPPLSREVYGWQLVQKLKMDRQLADIPIIICTTNLKALESNQGWLITKGVRSLPKPFTIDELVEIVRLQIEAPIDPDLPSAEAT